MLLQTWIPREPAVNQNHPENDVRHVKNKKTKPKEERERERYAYRGRKRAKRDWKAVSEVEASQSIRI